MLTVMIASNDPVSSAHLLAALQQTGLVKIVKQWTISSDKLPDAGDMSPDVVFLDLSRDPEHFFAFAAHVRRLRPAALRPSGAGARRGHRAAGLGLAGLSG